jgi:transposase
LLSGGSKNLIMLKYSIGIDISSKTFDVVICVIDGQQKVTFKSSKSRIPNTLEGFRILLAWIEKHYKNKEIPLVTCMEATGVYYENCAMFLFQAGYQVSVLLPNKAKKYMQSLGLKSKTDSIDSRGLAQMGAEQNLKLWQPMGEFFYKLRTLTRQHQNLQELKTGISNQIHAIKYGMYIEKTVLNQLKKTVKVLEKQLKEMEKAITKKLKENEEVFLKVEKICKIKGVAVLTAATLLAETNGFELFENSKQLVSYAGYDVVENQSGAKAGKTTISKKGNSRIRRCLYMPALCVVRLKQKIFRDLYMRTFEKHHIKMKSYVAVQKKLLTIIYALWKKEEAFDNDYLQQLNIQEKEQAPSSLHGSERAKKK